MNTVSYFKSAAQPDPTGEMTKSSIDTLIYIEYILPKGEATMKRSAYWAGKFIEYVLSSSKHYACRIFDRPSRLLPRRRPTCIRGRFRCLATKKHSIGSSTKEGKYFRVMGLWPLWKARTCPYRLSGAFPFACCAAGDSMNQRSSNPIVLPERRAIGRGRLRSSESFSTLPRAVWRCHSRSGR